MGGRLFQGEYELAGVQAWQLDLAASVQQTFGSAEEAM